MDFPMISPTFFRDHGPHNIAKGPRLLRSSEAFQGLAQATHQNGRMLVLRQTGRTVEQHHGQVFDDILLYIYI